MNYNVVYFPLFTPYTGNGEVKMGELAEYKAALVGVNDNAVGVAYLY